MDDDYEDLFNNNNNNDNYNIYPGILPPMQFFFNVIV